jgi:hypothetical protein
MKFPIESFLFVDVRMINRWQTAAANIPVSIADIALFHGNFDQIVQNNGLVCSSGQYKQSSQDKRANITRQAAALA